MLSSQQARQRVLSRSVQAGFPVIRFQKVFPVVSLAVAVVAAPMQTVVAEDPTPVAIFGRDPDAPCVASRLRVKDLDSVDATIDQGVEAATAQARDWQEDARLWTLRLSCPLLTTGIRWEGVFFSETAQAMYATDSGRKEAVEDEPDEFLTLDPAVISIHDVYRSLIRAGFADDLYLTPQGGVTIRYNTNDQPFGPPTAPREQVYAHLAIEQDGLIRDVWVSINDGTVYQYESVGQDD